MSYMRFLGVSLLCAAAANAAAQTGSATAAVEDEVWAMEEAYWRYAQAGDVDRYLALWHADFVGWVCSTLEPSRKAGIADWVRAIRDEPLELVYRLQRKASQSYGGSIVVVHYTTPVERTYPDGRVLWEGEIFKFTHTCMRVGDQWQIIGEMCGELGAPD